MAKKISTFKKIKDSAVNVVARDLTLFSNVYSALYNLFEEPKETVKMILISGQSIMAILDIAEQGSATEESVKPDFDKIEEALQTAHDMQWSFALAHNHPIVKDDEGKWVQSFISPGDIVVTNKIVSVASDHYPNAMYKGHFIVNMEDGDKKKMIYMDEDFAAIKFSKEVIDQIQKGEL